MGSPEAMKNETPNYLNELNKAQHEAVLKINGPVLVLAGAGTGNDRSGCYPASPARSTLGPEP